MKTHSVSPRFSLGEVQSVLAPAPEPNQAVVAYRAPLGKVGVAVLEGGQVARVSERISAGSVTSARVVLGHVATIPWRATKAEEALVGQPLGAASAAAAGKAAVEGAEPMTNNGYKVDLVTALVTRVVASLA